eukprot:scaffold58338_cov72-Phaeocystis_antarctica.AAC.2
MLLVSSYVPGATKILSIALLLMAARSSSAVLTRWPGGGAGGNGGEGGGGGGSGGVGGEGGGGGDGGGGGGGGKGG